MRTVWNYFYVNEPDTRGMTGYQVHKEYIWHFTCVSCNGYWSIATMDEWVPKTMFCPHCGKKQENDSEFTHPLEGKMDI